MIFRAIAEIGRRDWTIHLHAPRNAREFIVGATQFDLDAIDNGADTSFADGKLRAVARLTYSRDLDGNGESIWQDDRAPLTGLEIHDSEGNDCGEK